MKTILTFMLATVLSASFAFAQTPAAEERCRQRCEKNCVKSYSNSNKRSDWRNPKSLAEDKTNLMVAYFSQVTPEQRKELYAANLNYAQGREKMWNEMKDKYNESRKAGVKNPQMSSDDRENFRDKNEALRDRWNSDLGMIVGKEKTASYMADMRAKDPKWHGEPSIDFGQF